VFPLDGQLQIGQMVVCSSASTLMSESLSTVTLRAANGQEPTEQRSPAIERNGGERRGRAKEAWVKQFRSRAL
jgi:hypothetical protein